MPVPTICRVASYQPQPLFSPRALSWLSCEPFDEPFDGGCIEGGCRGRHSARGSENRSAWPHRRLLRVHCANLLQLPDKLRFSPSYRGQKIMQDGARPRAQHQRDMAAEFRVLAELEPVASLRRQLERLAARHDQLAVDLERPQSDDDGTPRAALG